MTLPLGFVFQTTVVGKIRSIFGFSFLLVLILGQAEQHCTHVRIISCLYSPIHYLPPAWHRVEVALTPDGTGQDRTGQDRTGQDRTGQDRQTDRTDRQT